MKFLKTFEKFNRPIFVGTEAKWTGRDKEDISPTLYTGPSSRDVNNGDLCEITQRKIVKGKLFVRAKNLKNNKNINLQFDAMFRPMPYNTEGSWLEYDRYFINDFDVTTRKFNI